MGDELAAAAALERGGDGDLDAELIGFVGLALADALHLGRVQGIDLLARAGAGAARARGGPATATAERPRQLRVPGELAGDVADHRAQHGAQPLERRLARLNCLAWA